MRPFARHGSRKLLFGSVHSSRDKVHASTVQQSPLLQQARNWTCSQCRSRGDAVSWNDTRTHRTWKPLSAVRRRQISTSTRRLVEEKNINHDGKSDSTGPPKPNELDDTVATTPSSTLPSHIEQHRWQSSRRAAKLMDRMLARGAVLSQQLNNYTGTDYSGIETLRHKITEQEQAVKGAHTAVAEAKERYTSAHSQRVASQKEVVSLLERKNSWSPTDLERYMSLIRSEHQYEQSVQVADDDMAAAERGLEATRSKLERLERKQYHEEQIWSDTIRRNSTWVTFGLMGVNILLLLTSLAVFEPYRRRKIVREVKAALDAKAFSAPNREVEKKIDEVIQPADIPGKALSGAAKATFAAAAGEILHDHVQLMEAEVGKTPLAAGEVLPEEAMQVVEDVPTPEPMLRTPIQPTAAPGPWSYREKSYRERFRDLFSERTVVLKKVDVTTIALEGTATGVAVMGLLFVLLRPK